MKLMLIVIFFSTSVNASYNNESELTVILDGGNTEQETWNAKTLNTFIQNKNTYQLGGHYSYGKATGNLTSKNADVNARYERSFSDKWASFAAIQREEDTFASIDYRWNYDLGGVLKFINTDRQKLRFEAGLRRSLESDFSGNKASGSKVRLFTEYDRQQNENFFFRLWIEALPNISESDDWQISFEPSLNFTMSKMFSLKVAYLHKYDNQPVPDNKNSDYHYTTSLIAKF